MAANTTEKKTRKGHLKDPTTTTINWEKTLLKRIQNVSSAAGQSVSYWVREAAMNRLSWMPGASSK